MNRRLQFVLMLVVLLCGPLLWLISAGCGGNALSSEFLNVTQGGQYPLTPGPGAGFVMVRTVNETNVNVEFVVTIERQVLELNDVGNPLVDTESGEFVFRPERQTVRLATGSAGFSSELGTLFPCRVSLVTTVGLGENLLPTDAAAFVGGEAGAGTGFGVSAATVNPLSYYNNNFDCGDTIIFRAFPSVGSAGGIGLETFLLPGSEQPLFSERANTFIVYEQFLETQIGEDEP